MTTFVPVFSENVEIRLIHFMQEKCKHFLTVLGFWNENSVLFESSLLCPPVHGVETNVHCLRPIQFFIMWPSHDILFVSQSGPWPKCSSDEPLVLQNALIVQSDWNSGHLDASHVVSFSPSF